MVRGRPGLERGDGARAGLAPHLRGGLSRGGEAGKDSRGAEAAAAFLSPAAARRRAAAVAPGAGWARAAAGPCEGGRGLRGAGAGVAGERGGLGGAGRLWPHAERCRVAGGEPERGLGGGSGPPPGCLRLLDSVLWTETSPDVCSGDPSKPR
ncbi:unnamed protein product [Coccothraustes coccothraustes]